MMIACMEHIHGSGSQLGMGCCCCCYCCSWAAVTGFDSQTRRVRLLGCGLRVAVVWFGVEGRGPTAATLLSPPECGRWAAMHSRCGICGRDCQCPAGRSWCHMRARVDRIDMRRVQTWMAFICLHSQRLTTGWLRWRCGAQTNPSSCRHS